MTSLVTYTCHTICRVLEPDGTIVREDKPIQMNTVTNFYNVHVPSSGFEGSTHVYEVIPDCVNPSAVFGSDEVSSCFCILFPLLHAYWTAIHVHFP